jgi:hypothetical protein
MRNREFGINLAARARLVMVFLAVSFIGCMGQPLQPRSEVLSVAPLAATTPASQTNVKREELSAEIMRYADRYSGRMSLEAERIAQQADNADLRWFAAGWNLASQQAVLDISLGPNAVENLLDMLVFASLTRIEVESYWTPVYLGPELGDGLLLAARTMEQDIWDLSGRVLTPEQQGALRTLIEEWDLANPDQHYFWFVRFSGFSGQRADDLARLQQTGGLLAEFQLARETAVEVKLLTERLLRYLQRAPTITRLQAQFALREVVRTPEFARLLDDLHRVSLSSSRYADFAEQLPATGDATIDALFARLREEREAAIVQMFDELSAERVAAIEQFAAREQEVITALLASRELQGTVEKIGDEGGKIANITFVRGVLLIVLWAVFYVLGKLVYDVIRMHRAWPASGGQIKGLSS